MPLLDWIGKVDVEKHAREVPTHLLRCDRDLSHGDPQFDLAPGTGNLVIEGDNLLALTALMPYYAGQVKCIYIDPPYNTGNEGWIYNDNVNSPQMKQWLGKAVDSEDLCRHDKWLCMMAPRLRHHHKLLREDGVIFISIDDNEVHHLRMLCDEIFGAQNFVAQIVWKSRVSEDTRALNGVSTDHEYLVCYGKAHDARLRGSHKDLEKFSNPDNDARGPWRNADLTGLATAEERPNLHYSLFDPATKIEYSCPEKGWRFDPKTMALKVKEGRVLFPKNGTGRPRHKLFLREMKSLYKNISSVITGISTADGTRELKDVMGQTSTFAFPKPTNLIELLVEQVTNPGDIVLDSFAGSGTTGHAVLKMNARNPDEPPRRFVLVEMEQYIARPITRKRLKRAIEGYGKHEPLDGGFRFCHLGEPLLDAEGGLNPDASWRDLAHFYYLHRFGAALEASKLDPATGYVGKGWGVSFYLLFDSKGLAPLNYKTLERLKVTPGPKMVYCECVMVPHALLERAQIEAYVVPQEVRL